MHRNDLLAILTMIVGLGSFATSVISLGAKWPLAVTITLLGLGAAGQTASQLLRIYGAPSTPQSPQASAQPSPSSTKEG